MGGGDIFGSATKSPRTVAMEQKKCATLHGRRMDLNQATGMTSDTM